MVVIIMEQNDDGIIVFETSSYCESLFSSID